MSVLLCAGAFGQNIVRNGEDLKVKVGSVRSIAPEQRTGFAGLEKSWSLFAVDADSDSSHYVVYCSQSAPSLGETYSATDAYVSSGYSVLHLWPAERKDVVPQAKKQRGRLYRVLIFKDVDTSAHPDIACDIHSVRVH